MYEKISMSAQCSNAHSQLKPNTLHGKMFFIVQQFERGLFYLNASLDKKDQDVPTRAYQNM